MKQTGTVGLYIIIGAAIFTAPLSASTDSLPTAVEAYFAALKDNVDRCAASSIVKKTRAAQLSGYFSGMMKKHPPVQSLIKTNAKGIVVFKRVRGKKQSETKRTVAKYPWFSQSAKSLKEYHCLVREKNGRDYLYLSIPIFNDVAKPGRFIGEIIAKVDVRKCFHEIAAQGAQPFLVRLNNRNIYEHAWKSKMIFVESGLNVPGMEKIILRYQKSGVSIVQQSETSAPIGSDTLAPNRAAVSSPIDSHGSLQAKPQAPSVSAAKKNKPIIVGLLVLIIVVTALLIIQIVKRVQGARSGHFSDDDRL